MDIPIFVYHVFNWYVKMKRRGAWSTRPGRDHVASRAARCAGRAGAGFLEAEGAKRVWRRDRKGPKCWVVLACGTRL